MVRVDWMFQKLVRYFFVLGAGSVLAAGLWINFAGLNEAGTGIILAYGEEKSHSMTRSGSDVLREGRLLAGKALAQDVLALRKARMLRQGYIDQVRSMHQQEEAREAAAGNGSSGISYSQKDYEVLQRIVEAEAGGCDAKGRILVANVIINRVKSQEFPNTVTGVVYQKSQFSPVKNGTLNSCTVSEETKTAVDRALAGEDYSQGALYFMNRRWSDAGNAAWFDQRLTYLFQHGGHEFFR